MPEPEIRPLRIEELTETAFAPYGTVIPPMEDGTPFGAHDAVLDLGQGTPRFYAMRLPNRGMSVSRITRHRRVTQVLASSGGAPWLIAVAPPPKADTDAAAPALEEIRAFRVPGDVAIKLHCGAWHAGPLFEAAEANFFNLELSDTNVTDHWTCDLRQTYGVTLALSE